jgi:hypothetical protein
MRDVNLSGYDSVNGDRTSFPFYKMWVLRLIIQETMFTFLMSFVFGNILK